MSNGRTTSEPEDKIFGKDWKFENQICNNVILHRNVMQKVCRKIWNMEFEFVCYIYARMVKLTEPCKFRVARTIINSGFCSKSEIF